MLGRRSAHTLAAMTNAIKRRRVLFAGILAAAALGTAAPTPADAHQYRCEGAVERLEAKFRQIEARRGYEAASLGGTRPGPATTIGASSNGDHRHRRGQARGLPRPRRDRTRRGAQRRARDARRRARAVQGDGRRPARLRPPTSPRRPALTSGTCASGATTRPRVATSPTTAASGRATARASARAGRRRQPGSDLGGFAGHRRRTSMPTSSSRRSGPATASAGTNTTRAVPRYDGLRPGYRGAHLVAEWIPALTGVTEKLTKGARVADIGCGHGASTTLMAKAYPKSRFTGFDYHDGSVETARPSARRRGCHPDGAVRSRGGEELPRLRLRPHRLLRLPPRHGRSARRGRGTRTTRWPPTAP